MKDIVIYGLLILFVVAYIIFDFPPLVRIFCGIVLLVFIISEKKRFKKARTE